MQITPYLLLLAYLHTYAFARPVTGDSFGNSEGVAGSNQLTAPLPGDSASSSTPGTWSVDDASDTTVGNNGGHSGDASSVNHPTGGSTTDGSTTDGSTDSSADSSQRSSVASNDPSYDTSPLHGLPQDSQGTANQIHTAPDPAGDTASGQSSSSESSDSGGADTVQPANGAEEGSDETPHRTTGAGGGAHMGRGGRGRSR